MRCCSRGTAKVDKCRIFGANVVIAGAHIGEAKQYADEHFGHQAYINGYDDPEIIAGTGTLGMEMMEQVACWETERTPESGHAPPAPGRAWVPRCAPTACRCRLRMRASCPSVAAVSLRASHSL